LTIDFVDK